MKIRVERSKTYIVETDVLVAKSAKIYTAEFTFDEEWDGFAVTAVFENGGVRYEQPLLEGTSCVIPWEVLEKPGYLYISVYGVKGNQRRVAMVSGGIWVRSGAEPGEKTQEPTPDQYEQIMAAIQAGKIKGDTGQSAYEYAVAGGYTGTEEEFAAVMADATVRAERYARNAADSAREAASSAEAAAASESAAGESASAAAESASAAQNAADSALNSARIAAYSAADAQSYRDETGSLLNTARQEINEFNTAAASAKQDIADTGQAQVNAVNNAGHTQVTAVNDAGTAQAEAVNNAGSTQKTAIETAGQEHLAAVNDAGNTQLAAVNSVGAVQKSAVEMAGAEQVDAVNAAGAAALETIGTGIDATLTQEGKAADAKVVGYIVSGLKRDIVSHSEALDNRIRKFYTSNIGAVSVPDSDDGAVRNLAIGGKCEQVKTNGYQLIDTFNPVSGKTYETNGVAFTVLEDGGIRCAGTSINVAYFAFNNSATENRIRLNDDCALIVSANESYSERGINFQNDIYVDGVFVRTLQMPGVSANNHYQFSGTVEIGTSRIIIPAGLTVDFVYYPMLEYGDTAHDWEPYTGGLPSPSPDYPQEIKCVENCAIVITNADGAKSNAAEIPFILRSIGDVQDELYVYADGTGKLVQRVQSEPIPNDVTWSIQPQKDGYALGYSNKLCNGAIPTQAPYNAIYMSKYGNSSPAWKNGFSYGKSNVFWIVPYTNSGDLTSDDINAWLTGHPMDILFPLNTPIETSLTAEQVQALFELRTYYGGTKITFTSDNGVEPVVNFDYACALDAFVEYIKAGLGDDRKFIYDMNERMTNDEYIAALAYVNSEYATALTELEV